MLLSVGYLQFFEEPFVMTKGGPLDSTLSISYFTYNQFGFGKYGNASAASYVLFVAIALLSIVQFRALRSKEARMTISEDTRWRRPGPSPALRRRRSAPMASLAVVATLMPFVWMFSVR